MAKPATAKLLLALLTLTIVRARRDRRCSIVECSGSRRESHLRALLENCSRLRLGIDSWYGVAFWQAPSPASSILLWMAAAGVNRSDEVRAGAVGVLVIARMLGGIVAAGVFWIARRRDRQSTMASYLVGRGASRTRRRLAGCPCTYVDERPIELARWFDAATWPFAGRRRASATAPWRRGMCAGSAASPAARDVGDRPFDSEPPRQLAWPAAAQSAHGDDLEAASRIAAAGRSWAPPRSLLRRYLRWPPATIGRGAVYGADVLADVDGVVDDRSGSFVAIVAGIGVFMDDLRPGLHTFWRSRPINVESMVRRQILARAC